MYLFYSWWIDYNFPLIITVLCVWILYLIVYEISEETESKLSLHWSPGIPVCVHSQNLILILRITKEGTIPPKKMLRLSLKYIFKIIYN